MDEQDLLSRLPTDVLLEILSRLPLRSISSCKWVCKSCFNVVRHPSLAVMHYARSVANNTSPCVLLYDQSKEFFLIDHQVFDEVKTSASLYNVQFRGNFTNNFEVVGSVNGLVCFAFVPDYVTTFAPLPYYICNPITGEHLSLPMSPTNEICHDLCGFGFDSITNKYKVIRILQNYKTFSAEAEVFTVGSSTWQTIPSIPYITDETQTNVLVNGSLHWLSFHVNSTAIVSFVISTEEFPIIQLPACFNDWENHGKEIYLAVLGNRLAFVMSESSSGPLSKNKEIWVMKEYGVQKSWIKLYVVRQKLMLSAWDGGYALTKLRNSEFLFQYRKKTLVYYDSQNETSKVIRIRNKSWGGCYEQALMHTGSLFSPNNIGQLRKSWHQGMNLCLDVTGTSPMVGKKTFVPGAATATAYAAKLKKSKHEKQCRDNGLGELGMARRRKSLAERTEKARKKKKLSKGTKEDAVVISDSEGDL